MTNSSYGLIFVKIWAKYGRIFSKITSEIRAKIRAKFKFLRCCLLQSVIDLFVKQLNYTFNLHKITKIRVKSLKYGRFCQKCPYIRACPYKYERLLHTGIWILMSKVRVHPKIIRNYFGIGFKRWISPSFPRLRLSEFVQIFQIFIISLRQIS